MCNNYRNRISLEAYRAAFDELQTPAGAPNLEPRDSIRVTEPAPLIRLDDQSRAELVQVRWSWPGPGAKPVYNFRSEGRRFGSGRCLIPADGFYEFTDPEPPAPKRAKKVRWLFTMVGQPWFCIAGLYRPGAAEGADAFTMLTAEPGPDIAPYHSRQVVVLGPDEWGPWLSGPRPEDLLRPSLAGELAVEAAL